MATGSSSETGFKQYFNAASARSLGQKIRRCYRRFDVEGYAAEVDERIPGKELKDRVLIMAEGLRTRLPTDYAEALGILVDSLGDPLQEKQGMFNDNWSLMAVARFVEEYGVPYPELSLEALREITQRHTAEFAIRPFIEHHYSMTMKTVGQWARHPNPHVRRAASEGIRPRLPWARVQTRFIENPRPVLDVLEHLRSDPSAYVRKSVANNLNDIAKDHPDEVLATAERWLTESPTAETTWIVRHALRTLIKRGDPRAIRLIGATGGERARIMKLEVVPRSIALGDTIKIRFIVGNDDTRPHKLTIDYVVHHVRKNGKTIPKVFKLAVMALAPGEQRQVEKTHAVRAITTRRYYPGKHAVDIQVNGRALASTHFRLRP